MTQYKLSNEDGKHIVVSFDFLGCGESDDDLLTVENQVRTLNIDMDLYN